MNGSKEQMEVMQQAIELIVPSIPALLAFVATWVIEIILVNKKIICHGKEKKIEKAKELGQVVTARLDSRKYQYDYNENGHGAARYIYSIDGIHQKKKVISVNHGRRWTTFPDTINIYYLGNKIYTDYDKSSAWNLLIPILPILVGGLVMYLTHPELFQ